MSSGVKPAAALDATERPSQREWPLGDFSANRRQCKIGGAGRDRTGDPLVANQVLSQLSYSPEVWWA